MPPLVRIFTLLMLIMQIKLLNSFIKLEVDLNQDKAIKALSEFDESQILNQYYNILMS